MPEAMDPHGLNPHLGGSGAFFFVSHGTGAWGLGLRAEGEGYGAEGVGFKGIGFRVSGFGASGFGVKGLGSQVSASFRLKGEV